MIVTVLVTPPTVKRYTYAPGVESLFKLKVNDPAGDFVLPVICVLLVNEGLNVTPTGADEFSKVKLVDVVLILVASKLTEYVATVVFVTSVLPNVWGLKTS